MGAQFMNDDMYQWSDNTNASSPSQPQSTQTLRRFDEFGSMPDWLAEFYERELKRFGTTLRGQQSAFGNVSARTVTGAMSGDKVKLDVHDFVLQGEPSNILRRQLDPSTYAAHNAYMTSLARIIEEAQKQVAAFMKNNDGLMPATFRSYEVGEMSGSLAYHPVQLATVLIDSILLASNEYETTDKDVRRRAILGMAERIIDRVKVDNSPEEANVHMIQSVLRMIAKSQPKALDRWHQVYLHARILVLEELAENLQ